MPFPFGADRYFQPFCSTDVEKFMHLKFMHFVRKSCVFHTLEKFMHFSKYDVILEIHAFFTLWRNSCIFHTFTEFRAFFKTSVFLKNSPFKVHLEFLTKIPCFFQKFPVQKTIDFTNSVFIPKKFRVLQNSPVFIFFKSLKTLEKTMYFYIKTG